VSPSNFIQTSQGVNFLPHKQTDSIYSGFVQYEVPIVRDKLTLTAGTKLEHNNFSGFDYQPSVRLLWTPTPHQSFWAAVTRAVRTPSRLDQNVDFAIFVTNPPPPVFFEIMVDPKLKAEQLIGYEAGYRTQINRNLYVDFTAFYNSYDDLQGYGPIGLAVSATLVNGRHKQKEPTTSTTVCGTIRGSIATLAEDCRPLLEHKSGAPG
jgi:iron complex outermembrane receptor protein